jgi:membrane peptidoglycan carboxypeptidase
VVPARLALGNSLNIPALKVEMYTGIPAVVDMARAMGVTSLTDPNDNYGLSLTLGGYPVSPLDMATGAATLADLGIRHRPAPILRVDNGLGQQIYNYDPSTNEFRAVDQQTAYIMGEILSNDANRCMEFGCGGDLTLPGRQVAAKTGTTQNFKDNWTIGYTPTLATAVWVGNPDNVPLYNSTGIVGAAPIWHQFMMQALAKVPNLWYQMPAGVDQIGNSYYLPGTENLPNFLAHSWPRCDLPYGYDPYTLTASQITVDGVYCVLN